MSPPRAARDPRGALACYRALQADPLGFFTGLAREHGPLVRFALPGTAGVLVADPDLVQQVLVARRARYGKNNRGHRFLRRVLGGGLVTNQGEPWRRQRRLIQPAFHPREVAALEPVMVRAGVELVASWEDGQVLDLAEAMGALTMRIAAETLFGADMTATAEVVGEALPEALRWVQTNMYAPLSFPLWVPTPGNRRYRAALARLHGLVAEVLAAKRAAGPGPDLLSRLLEARDEETGEGMDEAQLRDEVLTLFVAGHETTANALTWTLVLLSQAPAEARRAREGLAEALGGRPPEPGDAPALGALTRVAEEAMRLFPPAWMLSRSADEADELGGLEVPVGAVVFMSPFVIHRDPRHWPNPEGFDPARFEDDARAARHRFAYLPFGAGPRACVGAGFAMTELALVLGTLLHEVELELLPGVRPSPVPTVTLRPREAVPVRVRRRAGHGGY